MKPLGPLAHSSPSLEQAASRSHLEKAIQSFRSRLLLHSRLLAGQLNQPAPFGAALGCPDQGETSNSARSCSVLSSQTSRTEPFARRDRPPQLHKALRVQVRLSRAGESESDFDRPQSAACSTLSTAEPSQQKLWSQSIYETLYRMPTNIPGMYTALYDTTLMSLQGVPAPGPQLGYSTPQLDLASCHFELGYNPSGTNVLAEGASTLHRQ